MEKNNVYPFPVSPRIHPLSVQQYQKLGRLGLGAVRTYHEKMIHDLEASLYKAREEAQMWRGWAIFFCFMSMAIVALMLGLIWLRSR